MTALRVGCALVVGACAGARDGRSLAVAVAVWVALETGYFTTAGVRRRHDRQLRERLGRYGR